MDIRAARAEDLTEVEDIYKYYVETSIATFEEPTKRSTDFEQVFNDVRNQQLPFILAIDLTTHKVKGYAYAIPYNPCASYRYTVEDSIYVHPDSAGQGVGRQLLKALLDELRAGPIRKVIAVMSIMPDQQEDDSVTCRLHRAAGFVSCGRLDGVGFKFGNWIDVVYYAIDI